MLARQPSHGVQSPGFAVGPVAVAEEQPPFNIRRVMPQVVASDGLAVDQGVAQDLRARFGEQHAAAVVP